MTDYTKETGVDGELMIRDTGSVVEFYFKAGHSSDWVNGLKFSWTANGNTYNKTINYSTGADRVKVGSVTVTTSQTVTFRLVSDTNITGIGGPTSFSKALDRDTVPSKPSTPTISGVKANSVTVSFKDGANGGDPINSRQIGYGTSSSSPSTTISSDGSTTITGLSSGETYYFWARTHNSVGWSSWSGRASVKLLSVPDKTSLPQVSSVTATSADVSFVANGNGGSPITAYQIGYGFTAVGPTEIISASSPQVVTGLEPGRTYTFWARARNSVGWGDWAGPTYVTTVAGAYVKVGETWKLAVPYMNVGGVWKAAELWARNSGVWKRTL